jgi:hypothetical protein
MVFVFNGLREFLATGTHKMCYRYTSPEMSGHADKYRD